MARSLSTIMGAALLACGCGARIDSSNGNGPSGGACRPGDPPAVVVTGALSAIALDDEFVYFSGDTGLQRVRKSGGSVDAYPRASGEHSRLVVTGDRIYFADDGRSFVGWVPKTPSTTEPHVVAMRVGMTWWMDIRDSWLYVGRTSIDGSGAEILERISLTDGTATMLFSSSTKGVAVVRAALAGDDVVFAVGDDQRVLSVSQSGGPTLERFSNASVSNITSYGDTAFATVHGALGNGLQSGVVSVHANAAPEVNALPNPTMAFGPLASDGEFVYFTDPQERTIRKVSPKPGSTSTTLASLGIMTTLLAVDASCIYYVERTRPALMRAPK